MMCGSWRFAADRMQPSAWFSTAAFSTHLPPIVRIPVDPLYDVHGKSLTAPVVEKLAVA